MHFKPTVQQSSLSSFKLKKEEKNQTQTTQVRLFVLVIAVFSHKVVVSGKAGAIAVFSNSHSLLNVICFHKIAHARNCRYIEL